MPTGFLCLFLGLCRISDTSYVACEWTAYSGFAVNQRCFMWAPGRIWLSLLGHKLHAHKAPTKKITPTVFFSVARLTYDTQTIGDRGSTVVKVLCYKSEGRYIDSRWCHLNVSLTISFRSHYGPGVDSASNRNEYQEYFLGVKAAGAEGRQPTTILCRCHEIWET